MQFDVERYRHHLDGFNMSEDQKVDVVRAVYAFMKGMHDLIVGVDATQIALGMNGDHAGFSEAHALEWTVSINSTFNDAAQRCAAGKTT